MKSTRSPSSSRACGSLLGQLDLAGAQVHLRERRDGLRGVGVAPDLQSDREGLLEERNRLVGLPEEKRQDAESREELAGVRPVLDLLVESPCLSA